MFDFNSSSSFSEATNNVWTLEGRVETQLAISDSPIKQSEKVVPDRGEEDVMEMWKDFSKWKE